MSENINPTHSFSSIISTTVYSTIAVFLTPYSHNIFFCLPCKLAAVLCGKRYQSNYQMHSVLPSPSLLPRSSPLVSPPPSNSGQCCGREGGGGETEMGHKVPSSFLPPPFFAPFPKHRTPME